MTLRRTLQILLIVFVIATMYVMKDDIADLFQRAKGAFTSYLEEQNVLSDEDQMNKKTNNSTRLPGPLRALTQLEADNAHLTVSGIIEQTNEQRINNGLEPLTENNLLSQSASVKVSDMFENNYFEHDSPDGVGVGDLGESVGYDYITIGENLAQGNFPDDMAVVSAWMNSKGHRENILNSRYTEIGVAVQRGQFNGNEMWMVVQHFGLPRTECPEVRESLRNEIEVNRTDVAALEEDIIVLQEEIEEMNKFSSGYNKKVEEHNELVDEYNLLVNETKEAVRIYNTQVDLYNDCANND